MNDLSITAVLIILKAIGLTKGCGEAASCSFAQTDKSVVYDGGHWELL